MFNLHPLHKVRTTGISCSGLQSTHDLRVRSTLWLSRHVPHMNPAESVGHTIKQEHLLVILSQNKRFHYRDMHTVRLSPSSQCTIFWQTFPGFLALVISIVILVETAWSVPLPVTVLEGLWYVDDGEETVIVGLLFKSCVVARLCACV